MSAQANTEVARRFFEEFCTGRKRELASHLMTVDYVYHDPQVPSAPGPEGMADAVAVFQNGLDGRWNIDEVVAGDGEHVTVRWTGTGTHNAEVMGIPPTGKSVRVSALSLLRFQDGKIAEQWCTWDTLGFLQQLGVAPMPQQAPA